MEKQLSEYELANDLPPVSNMSPEAIQRERAQINQNIEHPFWKDGPNHAAAVRRVQALCEAGPPAKSDLAKSLERSGIHTEEDIDKISQRGFAEIQEEKLRRDYEKFRNEIALKFPDLHPDEFDTVIASANTAFNQLQSDGLLAPDFGEFLVETGERSKPETLKFFSDASKLQSRYAEWAEKRKKK